MKRAGGAGSADGADRRPIHLIHNDAGDQVCESVAEAAVLEAVGVMEVTLRELGRPVVPLLLKPPLSAAAAALEALPAGATVFNLFEGFPDDPASEVQIGLLLERLGCRATGCPPLAMHFGLHKELCKLLLKAGGIPVPEGVFVKSPRDLEVPLPFPFPVFLKPAANDASHGIAACNLVRDREGFRSRAAELLKLFPGGVLAEPFLSGRELNCSVVETLEGPVALPPSLVDYSELPEGHPPVLTFAAKWAPGSPVYEKTPTVCPAPVEPELVARVQELSLRSFLLLRCRGYARVDLREDAAGDLRVLELNPNPDISADAGLAKQARAAGWDYPTLVSRIITAIEEGPPWTSP